MTAVLTAADDAKRRATRSHVASLVAAGITGDALAKELGITDRQLEVLRLAARGLSNLAIAQRLFVAEDTVKTHRRRTTLALGARNGAHTVGIAYQVGILHAFVSRCPACDWAPGRRTGGGAS